MSTIISNQCTKTKKKSLKCLKESLCSRPLKRKQSWSKSKILLKNFRRKKIVKGSTLNQRIKIWAEAIIPLRLQRLQTPKNVEKKNKSICQWFNQLARWKTECLTATWKEKELWLKWIESTRPESRQRIWYAKGGDFKQNL